MKKDRIHIYEMESYKHASEEQRNSMRICKIRYFDLEGLPSKEVKEILEAFIWERGKTLALSSLATELTTYNNIRKFLIEKNITVLQNAGPEKTVRILKGCVDQHIIIWHFRRIKLCRNNAGIFHPRTPGILVITVIEKIITVITRLKMGYFNFPDSANYGIK